MENNRVRFSCETSNQESSFFFGEIDVTLHLIEIEHTLIVATYSLTASFFSAPSAFIHILISHSLLRLLIEILPVNCKFGIASYCKGSESRGYMYIYIYMHTWNVYPKEDRCTANFCRLSCVYSWWSLLLLLESLISVDTLSCRICTYKSVFLGRSMRHVVRRWLLHSTYTPRTINTTLQSNRQFQSKSNVERASLH